MRQDIELLITLQDIDSQILKSSKEAKRIPLEKEHAESRLAESQSALDASLAEKRENELAIKALELDIETRKNTINRLKLQQFETKKNEEYQTLGHEVTNYEGMVEELEGQELELMLKADGIEENLSTKQATLDEIKSGIAEEIAVLDKKENELTTEITKLQAAKKEQTSPVDSELLELYERLLANKDGRSLARVSDAGQCSGCHIKVTPATLIAIQSEKEIIQCENCGRIAYQ